MKPIRVISTPVDDGGCGWYRIRQPFEMLRKYTVLDTHIIDKDKDDMLEVAQALKVADIVVMRPGAGLFMRQVRDIKEYSHLKYVLDIDDNVEILSPYSNHYEEYGTKNVKHYGKWLWKDGSKNFSIADNKKRVFSYLDTMSKVDLVTVTTEKLKEYAEQYNDNVIVLPNSINLDNWWKLDLKKKKTIRVGWAGGSSHYEDWYSIKEPLNKLMREFQFELWMIGHSFPGVIDDDNKHLLKTTGWMPFKGHSYRLMCLDLDIAIIPLADLPFNHYKSSVKWYEMSAIEVPSVVANILPYSKDINKSTAFGYSTPKEFEKALRIALTKPQARKKIGINARKWVESNRDAKKTANLYVEAYRSLLTSNGKNDNLKT